MSVILDEHELTFSKSQKGGRVFLNDGGLLLAKFIDQASYTVDYMFGWVKVYLDPNGKRTVCSGPKGNTVDLQNKKMLESLGIDCEKVQVTYYVGYVIIRPSFFENKVKRRLSNLINCIKKNVPIPYNEFFMGTGLLSRQIKRGFKKLKLSLSMAFGNDHSRLSTDLVANSHPELTHNAQKNARIVNADIRKLDMSSIPEAPITLVSYPCVGFSQQMSSIRDMDIKHKDAGLLFVPTLEALNISNSAIIILECSPNFQDSTTDYIIENSLKVLGYRSAHTTLKGTDFGGFEPRQRLAKVFYTEGLPDLDLELLIGNEVNTRTVRDVVEPISDNSPMWRDLSYLRAKDLETNHGHKFIVTPLDSNKTRTFPATYAKTQADTPLLEHPTNSELHRIFSVSEHCNVRGIKGPLKDALVSIEKGTHHLQKGRTGAGHAHHLCGNSISPEPWEKFGSFIAEWLTSFCSPDSEDCPSFYQALLEI